jgi:hypothetical protein
MVTVCDVDFDDMTILVSHWLEQRCTILERSEGAYIDRSGSVDVKDFAIFAAHWLAGVE